MSINQLNKEKIQYISKKIKKRFPETFKDIKKRNEKKPKENLL
jgi:hypothetical protein